MFFNIKYVNPPGPTSSGKFGSIVGQDGAKVYVPVDLLGQFKVGTSVEIATKEQTWGGNPVIVATSGPGGVAQGQGYRPSVHGTPSRETGQRANTGFVPRVYQGGVGQPAAGGDQGRHIFVTGTVGRAMGSGKFAASELAVLTQAACEAYDKVLAAPPNRREQADQAWTGQNAPLEPPGPEPGDPGPELQ